MRDDSRVLWNLLRFRSFCCDSKINGTNRSWRLRNMRRMCLCLVGKSCVARICPKSSELSLARADHSLVASNLSTVTVRLRNVTLFTSNTKNHLSGFRAGGVYQGVCFNTHALWHLSCHRPVEGCNKLWLLCLFSHPFALLSLNARATLCSLKD